MIAFLRAINVGGHTVTMETLRAQFLALGFADVETFIASGNVIYTAPGKPTAALGDLKAFESEFDTFAAQRREVYWLCRVKQSESRFANAVFEKTLGVAATWRSINTLQRLSVKHPPR
jgi:uncharacterized protein (DUF1697 family)